jgi:hypothetical protein
MDKKSIIALFVLVASTLLFGSMFLMNEKREPITITSHASLEKMELDDLITKADIISIGKVETIYPSRWNTLDGRLTRGTTAKNISPNLIILTDVSFQMSQIIKGDIKQNVIRIRMFGGQVEQDRMIVEEQPSLKVGEIYLLFLMHDTGSTANINQGHYLVLGAIQGVYKISNDKAVSVAGEWALKDLIDYIQKSLP